MVTVLRMNQVHEVFRNSTPTRQAGALLTPGGHLIGSLTPVTLELACQEWRQISPPFFGFGSDYQVVKVFVKGIHSEQSEFVCNNKDTHTFAAIFVGPLIWFILLEQPEPHLTNLWLTITWTWPSSIHNNNKMSAQRCCDLTVRDLYLEYSWTMVNSQHSQSAPFVRGEWCNASFL